MKIETRGRKPGLAKQVLSVRVDPAVVARFEALASRHAAREGRRGDRAATFVWLIRLGEHDEDLGH